MELSESTVATAPVVAHETQETKTVLKKEHMSEVKQFFDNPMSAAATGSGWPAALAGGVVGYLAGNGGIGGNGHKGDGHHASVTPDQLQTSLAALQGNLQREALQGQIGDLKGDVAGVKCSVDAAVASATNAINCSIGGVKDAVVAGSQAAALAHCNLGNQMAQGFASVNTNMATHFGDLKTQMLQQALDAERARATELRIELSEHKNASGHASTQVLINQLMSSGKA